MTRRERQHVSLGKKVRRTMVRHFNKVSSIVMLHLMGRLAALLPLFLSVSFGQKLPLMLGITFSAVLYVAVVLFMRFWGRESFRRLFYSRQHTHKPKSPFDKWLRAGLLRMLRGFFWGLPFLAGVVYFTVFYQKLDVKTFWMPIRYLAVGLGQEPNIAGGSVMALVLMGLFGLLFAYGWMRDMPVEYLPVRSLGVEETYRWARKIMKNYRGKVWKNAAVNALLSLPALIGAGAVLVPYVTKNVDFSLSPDLVLNRLIHLAREQAPMKVILLLAAVGVVLYLPLCVYRKMRNAALVGKLMKDSSHRGRESQHRESSSVSSIEPKYVNLEGTPLGKQTIDEQEDGVTQESEHEA